MRLDSRIGRSTGSNRRAELAASEEKMQCAASADAVAPADHQIARFWFAGQEGTAA